jgi:NAD(P)-dependent dehydrogenase (short-subunit alcohol dehydrogenase family)
MEKIILITSLENDFDKKMAEVFVREGCKVFTLGGAQIKGAVPLPHNPAEAAGLLREQAGKLDYLLDTTDAHSPEDVFTVRDGIKSDVVEYTYRHNVLRSMALLEAFLPLLDEGEGKRLFYLTRAGASINETRDKSGFGYNMSKAALHQFIQMTRNKLAPKGYTFRVFDPMVNRIPSDAAAESAYNYITRRRGTENGDPRRDDEDNLVFRDAEGRQHSW